MTPKEIRGLEPGQWLTFTPNIWADSIDGKITDIGPETIRIEWDDGLVSVMPPANLHSSKFQSLEPQGPVHAEST
jgi:hypothetical protein